MRFVGTCIQILFAIIGIAAASMEAGAIPVQPPSEINLHAQLLDLSGQPLSGVRTYRVRFFSAATDGTQLGTDITGTATLPANGLFDIAVTPPTEALDAAECWYELAVESEVAPDGTLAEADTFTQRVRFYSVPFALRAKSVSTTGIGSGLINDSELDALDGVTSNVQTQIDLKADASALAAKADTTDVYTKTEIDTQLTTVNNSLAKVIKWEEAPSIVQAEPNHGYVITDEFTETYTLIALPPIESLTVGDIIRVSGAKNGWAVVSLTDDIRLMVPESAKTWVKRNTTANWSGLAIDNGGEFITACAQNKTTYSSSDSGATWEKSSGPSLDWSAIASGFGGFYLVASEYNGKLYTSTDSGATWTPRDADRAWKSVSSSKNGTKLQACDYLGYIYTSDDAGVTWTPHDSVRNWVDVACSADGSALVAAVYGGQIYVSPDSGTTWYPQDSTRNWISVASAEANGHLVACVNGGQIYVSYDSGAVWTPRESNRDWWSVASSADGSTLVASVMNGELYVSRDSGTTWEAQGERRAWGPVAISNDGKTIAAADMGGYIYTYSERPQFTALGQAQGLRGDSYAAIELQYVSEGLFVPLSHEGKITPYLGN